MSEKPAIIFITCDEMRLDTLSCYGGDRGGYTEHRQSDASGDKV